MRPTYKPEFEDMSGFFDCLPTCEACTFKKWQLPIYGEVAVNQWKNYASLAPRAEVSWSMKIFLAHDVKHVERVTSEEEIIQ
jgi:hypothetical protein